MNTDEAAGIFKELGWLPKLNVDRYADREFEDRTVSIGFKIKSFTTFQKFEAYHAIKNTEFSTTVKEIEGGISDYNDLLKVDINKTRFQETKITRKHIEIATSNAMQWAMSVDIDARYHELCELEPSTPGAAGVWHLAALVLKGRANQLFAYQSRFQFGDSCGFVPFVTQDYIDRAVNMLCS